MENLNRSKIGNELLHHYICPNVEQASAIAMDVHAFNPFDRISRQKCIDSFSTTYNLVYYSLCLDNSYKLIVLRGPSQCGKSKSLQQFLYYLRQRHILAIDFNFANIQNELHMESFLNMAILEAITQINLDFHIGDVMKFDTILKKLPYRLTMCNYYKIMPMGILWNHNLFFTWTSWKTKQQNNLKPFIMQILNDPCSNKNYVTTLMTILAALAEVDRKLQPIVVFRDLHKSILNPRTSSLIFNLLQELFHFIDNQRNHLLLFPVVMEMSDYVWYDFFYVRSHQFNIPKLSYDAIVMEPLFEEEIYQKTVYVYQLLPGKIFNLVWQRIGHDRSLWSQFLYRYDYLKIRNIGPDDYIRTIINQLQLESDLKIFHILSQVTRENKSLSLAFLKTLHSNNYVLNTLEWIVRQEAKYFLQERLAYIDKEFNFQIQHKLYQASIQKYYERIEQK
ncbi:hypothetical protein TrispH2_007618 [Trichoplax sp. H2]|nr:hypothetical protein TrispH2_007618 [Trichoplax sp. H2]|eukprot:RDD40079.1 hypothetical protein TrispH2_007618 [Trichoplax sp. H2]